MQIFEWNCEVIITCLRFVPWKATTSRCWRVLFYIFILKERQVLSPILSSTYLKGLFERYSYFPIPIEFMQKLHLIALDTTKKKTFPFFYCKTHSLKTLCDWSKVICTLTQCNMCTYQTMVYLISTWKHYKSHYFPPFYQNESFIALLNIFYESLPLFWGKKQIQAIKSRKIGSYDRKDEHYPECVKREEFLYAFIYPF